MTQPSDERSAPLSTAQVAAQIGYSTRTVHRYLDTNEFPGAWKTKNKWRIPSASVDAFIAARRIP